MKTAHKNSFQLFSSVFRKKTETAAHYNNDDEVELELKAQLSASHPLGVFPQSSRLCLSALLGNNNVEGGKFQVS